jgi:PA14 domain
VQEIKMTKKPIDSRLPAVLSVLLLLTAAACGLSEDSFVAPKTDASTNDAKAGGGGAGKAAGGGAGSATAGNFGGNFGGGDLGGMAGTGGTAGSDVADAEVDTYVTPPPMCPADAMPVEGTGRGLKGEYFVGQDPTVLTNLKVTRYDASVNFNWGQRAPEVGIPADHFSVRWSGQVQPRYSGAYTFYINSDDGARLTIGSTVVIDHFTDHGAMEDTGTPIELVGGQKYDIKLDYYENGGDALASLSWDSLCQPKEIIPPTQLYFADPVCAAPTVGTGTGVKGEYYDNQDLSSLVATHLAEGLDWNWAGATLPDPAVAPGTYSVRWTGQVQAKRSESVTFYTTSDDGVRLFVDDVLVIENWTDHAAFEDAGTVTLVAGQKYNLRLEFYENGGGAQIKLSWASGCMPKETIPLVQLYPTYTGVVCLAPSVGTGTGLVGDYYNTIDFMDLKVTHAAEIVNFDFADQPPVPTVGADNFSIRWTGQVQARYSGPTTFRTMSDDGARLWIGGVLVIDNWVDHGPTEDTAVVTLTAGQKYDVRLDYHETALNAQIRLRWSGPCQVMEPIPATMLYPTGYTGIDAGSAIDSGAPVDAGTQ